MKLDNLTLQEKHAKNVWLFSFYLAGIRVIPRNDEHYPSQFGKDMVQKVILLQLVNKED